jgi:hypothetical protein
VSEAMPEEQNYSRDIIFVFLDIFRIDTQPKEFDAQPSSASSGGYSDE